MKGEHDSAALMSVNESFWHLADDIDEASVQESEPDTRWSPKAIQKKNLPNVLR